MLVFRLAPSTAAMTVSVAVAAAIARTAAVAVSLAVSPAAFFAPLQIGQSPGWQFKTRAVFWPLLGPLLGQLLGPFFALLN